MSPPSIPAQVLVVDDDDDLRAMVSKLLERAGLGTIEARDGNEGLRKFFDSRPDLVVLDVEMPGLDGFAVLKRFGCFQACRCSCSPPAGWRWTRSGMKGGADDYVTKPFGRQELVARVEGLLRRGAGEERGAEPEVLSDRLEVDFSQARAMVGGQEPSLTPLEFRLLAAFMRNPRQVLSQEQLLELAWSGSSNASREQVKLYVGYLRRKLRDASGAEPLETVRGFGYRYDPGAA